MEQVVEKLTQARQAETPALMDMADVPASEAAAGERLHLSARGQDIVLSFDG